MSFKVGRVWVLDHKLQRTKKKKSLVRPSQFSPKPYLFRMTEWMRPFSSRTYPETFSADLNSCRRYICTYKWRVSAGRLLLSRGTRKDKFIVGEHSRTHTSFPWHPSASRRFHHGAFISPLRSLSISFLVSGLTRSPFPGLPAAAVLRTNTFNVRDANRD